MKKLLLLISAALLLSFGFNCSSSTMKYESIEMRKVPYSLDSDIFRVNTKEDSYKITKVRVMPAENIIKGIDIQTGSAVNISLREVTSIEKQVK